VVQVAPLTIHPAFLKAADYFGLKMTLVPLNRAKRPDMQAYKQVCSFSPPLPVPVLSCPVVWGLVCCCCCCCCCCCIFLPLVQYFSIFCNRLLKEVYTQYKHVTVRLQERWQRALSASASNSSHSNKLFFFFIGQNSFVVLYPLTVNIGCPVAAASF